MSSWTKVKYTKNYATKFAVRESAWNKKKAARGVLEEVVIKRIEVIPIRSTNDNLYVLYIDTYNSHWNDDMLVSHAEAVTLATDYYLRRIANANAALVEQNPNSCSP